MQNDTTHEISVVKDASTDSLISRIVRVYLTAGSTPSKASMRLCLEIDQVSRHDSDVGTRPRIIRHCHSDEYIAISCPWSLPEKYPISGRYRLSTRKQIDTIMPPDVVLDRILNFKACNSAYQHAPFWIDKLCIDQNQNHEKETAMRSMDLVYQYSGRRVYGESEPRWVGCSLGLLFVEIETIEELTTLRRLLTDEIAQNINNKAKLLVPVDEAVPVLDIIEKILSDSWWRRAWIFQEEFLASRHMKILLPCKLDFKGLFEPKYGVIPFGETSGEIEISPFNFRSCVTYFCLALYQHADRVTQRRCTEILQYARRYTFLYRNNCTAGPISVVDAMSPAIFEDIGARGISVLSDILAITANCCRFTTRLDSNTLNDASESLSIAILTLFIVNGEILRHDVTREAILKQNIYGCLHNAKLKIDPPLSASELIFIKMCRLPIIATNLSGLTVQGALCQLDMKIKVEIRESDREIYWDDDDVTPMETPKVLTDAECNLLRILARQLKALRVNGGDALHQLLTKFVEHQEAVRSRKRIQQYWSYNHIRAMMAKAVCRAIVEGKPLWMSRMAPSPRDEFTPWLGIFLPRDSPEFGEARSFVFVSREPDVEVVDYTGRGATLARKNVWVCSLEVHYDAKTREIVPERWLNGLHFFSQEGHSSHFEVPWPKWMH